MYLDPAQYSNLPWAIRLLDLNGKTWLEKEGTVENTMFSLYMDDVPTGPYLVELVIGEERHSFKLVVEY